MSFSTALPIVSTSWPGARRTVISPAACTESVVFRSPGFPPMIPFTSADGSAIVRMLNCSAAFGSSGRAPWRASSSAPEGSAFQFSSSSGVGGTIPCRSTSGSNPLGPAVTALRERMSTWIAFNAAPPYIPECRSRSPVVTFTSKAMSPRVDRLNMGTSTRSIPPSKMIPAFAPMSSFRIQSTIVVPPISSSPSHAKRRLTGNAFCSTSRCAALSKM